MLKKFTSLLFAAAAIFFYGCGSESTEPTFTVGFDADFPPYGYVENGKYTGFDLELAAGVAKRNNWKLILKPISWDAKDMELASGSIDCIWNGFTINGREDAYEWSDPYVDNSQVFLVLKDSAIKDFGGIAGKVVAVQADTPVQKALSSGGKLQLFGKSFRALVVTPTYNNAVMELEAGSVDAVAMDIGVAQEKMKSGKFRILDQMLFSEKYGIGFLKGNKTLRDKVQQTLIEMVKDGSAAEISQKYFKRDVLIIGR